MAEAANRIASTSLSGCVAKNHVAITFSPARGRKLRANEAARQSISEGEEEKEKTTKRRRNSPDGCKSSVAAKWRDSLLNLASSWLALYDRIKKRERERERRR